MRQIQKMNLPPSKKIRFRISRILFFRQPFLLTLCYHSALALYPSRIFIRIGYPFRDLFELAPRRDCLFSPSVPFRDELWSLWLCILTLRWTAVNRYACPGVRTFLSPTNAGQRLPPEPIIFDFQM